MAVQKSIQTRVVGIIRYMYIAFQVWYLRNKNSMCKYLIQLRLNLAGP